MTLLLNVVSYKNTSPVAPVKYEFGIQGGSIGRGSQCDWILEDPDKFLSGQHATISYTSPDFILTDTSSNGVYINQSSSPLGKGRSTPLSSGDSIEIGEYQILIAFKIETVDVGIDLSDDPFSNFSDELLGGNNKDSTTEEAEWFKTTANDDPFSDWENAPLSASSNSEPDNVSDLNAFFPDNNATPNTPVESKTDTLESNDPFGFPTEWASESPTHTPELNPEQVEPKEIIEPPPAAHCANVETARKKPKDQSPSSDNEIDRYLQAFLKGAELAPDNLPQALSPEIFFLIGQVLRTTVQGSMDVLMARSEIKNEMRLDVTTLRSVHNNPIKFSLNADEALSRLLATQQKGYMPPAQAVEEAFEDIRAHQIAVLAGMQTALHSILKRFAPNRLEERLHKSSPISASIPIHRQAKLWDLFEQLYEDIQDEAQDDFNQLFGRAFSKAYEEQIKKIKAAHNRRPME